jgi:phosphoribosylformylglycinamidine synthase
MKARIKITLKNGVLDPQGKAIEGALSSLAFTGVDNVRQGKYIELDIDETDAAKARSQVDAMCQKLLANTVIENYEVELG